MLAWPVPTGKTNTSPVFTYIIVPPLRSLCPLPITKEDDPANIP